MRVHAAIVLRSVAAQDTLGNRVGDMNKEVKIVATIGVVLALFVGVNSCQKEYRRIQSRVETTQAKVDALADELKATTATIHAAIRSITERFLALEASRIESQVGQAEVLTKVEEVKKQADNFNRSAVPTIVMHSGYSCGPCNAWISNLMPRWKQAGWRVDVVKEMESQRAWPWYEITDRDGVRFEVDGPLTNDSFQLFKPRK